MSDIKPFKSYDDQIDILKKRGMIINDLSYAKDALSRINYYRFTGYFYQLKDGKEDRYLDGVTFEQMYQIYEFDARLRNLLLFMIEKVEVLVKTEIAYQFSSKYQPLGYLDAANFVDATKHAEFMKIFNKRVTENRTKNFVRHHLKEYEAKFPLWVASELFSFGMLNNFYANLKPEDKKMIAKRFGISYDLLAKWLEAVSYARNIVAHYMRLYNFSFANKPRVKIAGRAFTNPTGRIFDIFYILSYLYQDKKEWENYIIPNLKGIFRKYKGSISLDLLGFPRD